LFIATVLEEVTLKLSADEEKRRESILEREFANTTLSQGLVKILIKQLRDMPTASFMEPIGHRLSSKDKQMIYDIMKTSPFLQEQSEVIRVWLQLRVQDVIERGHIPSQVEIMCIKDVLGKEIASEIILTAVEILKDFDDQMRHYVTSPKNEIETKIFECFKGDGHGDFVPPII
jgi:galactitol-specific phosphotransferase system IIB component